MIENIDPSVTATFARWREQLAASPVDPDADKFDYPAVVDGVPVVFRGCRIVSVEST